MNIILGKENLERLLDKHIILELDTFEVSGKEVVSYCVLGVEDVPLNELSDIDQTIKLHDSFVDGLKRGEKKFCQELGEILMKMFDGMLLEYYTHAIDRLNHSVADWKYVIIK
jgi:hypothetical protein